MVTVEFDSMGEAVRLALVAGAYTGGGLAVLLLDATDPRSDGYMAERGVLTANVPAARRRPGWPATRWQRSPRTPSPVCAACSRPSRRPSAPWSSSSTRRAAMTARSRWGPRRRARSSSSASSPPRGPRPTRWRVPADGLPSGSVSGTPRPSTARRAGRSIRPGRNSPGPPPARARRRRCAPRGVSRGCLAPSPDPCAPKGRVPLEPRLFFSAQKQGSRDYRL